MRFVSQFVVLCTVLSTPVFSHFLTQDFQTGGSGGSCGKSASHEKVAKAEKKEAKAAEKGKSMSLTGWLKEDNGNTVFENDKDKQAWNVANPDSVKGHEGHHVKITAKLNETDHSLNVEKLSMMRKSKQSAEMQQKDTKK
jgi:hypothetical protein